MTDVELPGSIAPLSFSRLFASNSAGWVEGNPLAGVPKPFGASATTPDSVEWWHEYVSLVVATDRIWSVRMPGGQVRRFTPCGVAPCVAAPDYWNASIRERLERTVDGFVVHDWDGRRLIFDAPYAVSGGPVERYFLSRIDGRMGAVEARLIYAQPADVRCPAGGQGTAPGVPYLSEVQGPESTLALAYQPLQRADGQYECVLSSVSLKAPGTTPRQLVAYAYTQDGMVQRPGRIASVARADGNEEYQYLAGELLQVSSTGSVVHHYYGADGRVLRSEAPGETVEIAGTATSVTCQPGSNCCYAAPKARTVAYPPAGRGDGDAGTVGFTRTYETLDNNGQLLEPRLYRTIDSCSVKEACSPGTTQSEWTCSTSTTPGYEKARKDKRGNWEVYTYQAADAGLWGMQLERTEVRRGATSMDGGDALEVEGAAYTYGPHGEQLLSTSERPSLLGGPGQKARTASIYEDGTGRLKATIRSGWTLVRASDGTWSPEKRFIGTFYFTSRVLLGESVQDPLGRTLEVHGPCFLESESATDCASQDFPLTQHYYWPEMEDSPRRNRLRATYSYPSVAAPPLVTTFNAYDAWGNPTEVVDANGTVTRLSYDEDRLVTSAVGDQPPTRYGYDGGHLTWVQHPEGNYDVYCYRTGTPTAACSGGTLSSSLQWKAKASVADGAAWREKVTYAYWPDGTTKEERFLYWNGSAAEERRVQKYAADAHRRPTWQGWGEGAGAYAAPKLYDGADNLIGIGSPYNGASAWCGGVTTNGKPSSVACSALSYDRADRLQSADVPTVGGYQPSRTCFTYDAQGNVASVRIGCATSSACGACSQPATFYVNDDFGRMVSVSVPHADGPVRYAYDAQGNVTLRETEAMRQAGEYVEFAYDNLSRLLSATRVFGGDSAGREVLYRLGYDGAEAPEESCPQPAYTMGRLRFRTDSFGRTWYQYDEAGRIVGELRVRAGTTACSGGLADNPHTFYSYTANGNIRQVVYPHGRVVTYIYGTDMDADRVQAVDVGLFDGTTWTTTRILSAAVWEPFGGLRGYQLHHPTSGGVSAVEYVLGDNANDAPTGCSATAPQLSASDRTGRVRSIRVSAGALVPGSGAGDIYQRTYTWKGEQVVRIDTCALGATTPHTEQYSYEPTLRLRTATANQNSAGGAYSGRSYGFYPGIRGNRLSEVDDGGPSHTFSYGTSEYVDRLLLNTVNSDVAFAQEYTYDADGRVKEKRLDRASSSAPVRPWLAFAYGVGAEVATDTVFRAVLVNGLAYNYYYDAQGRRRAKVYPSGARDEYFYDTSNHLLTDQGANSALPPTGYLVEDDYVWLDGRAVAVVRGRFSPDWVRASDTSADCARNGEAAACGVYFPVTDHLTTPVLMLDSSRRVAGLAEYDPFGYPNRMAVLKGTAHPYANSNGSLTNLTYCGHPVGGTANPTTTVRVRARFGLVDTESSGGVPTDFARLKDYGTSALLTGPIGGQMQGPAWTDWVQPSAGRVYIAFAANASNCCPDGNGGLDCNTATCPQAPNYPYAGVSVQACEYQRFQTGASPFWTPLRFPGQYHDAETDLFENWNRYYDPSIGRYLQPEPMLQRPNFVRARARQGLQTPAYAYASNNPIGRVDVNGREDTAVLQWLLERGATRTGSAMSRGGAALTIEAALLLYEVGKFSANQFPDPGAGTDPEPAPAPAPLPHPSSEPGTPASPEEGLICGPQSTYMTCRELEDEFDYPYGDDQEAMCEFPDRATKRKPKATTSGPCIGIGTHFNVVDNSGGRLGSIVCCPCCDGYSFEMRCGTR